MLYIHAFIYTFLGGALSQKLRCRVKQEEDIYWQCVCVGCGSKDGVVNKGI